MNLKRLLIDVATVMLVLATLFCSTSVRVLSGVSNRFLFLFILAIAAYYLPAISRSLLKPDNRPVLFVLISSVILIVFKQVIGQSYIKDVFTFIIFPLLLYLVFEQMDKDSRRILRRIVLWFFILECAVAIVERILKVNFFSYVILEDMIDFYNTGEAFAFRSTALFGNPLRNGFIVSIGMAFIAIDKTISVRDRLILVILGFVALLGFNGRASILVVSITIFPYILVEYYKEHHFNIFAFSLSVLAILFMWRILTTTSMGGRLFHGALIDGSTEARILALQYKNYITDWEFWTGSPELYDRVRMALDTNGVENGVICWILNYGVFFTVLILPMLVLFHWKKLGVYPRNLDRWLVMAVFYLIGVTNPNLAQQQGWTYWILFYFAFSPGSYVPRPKVSAEEYLRRRYRSIAG